MATVTPTPDGTEYDAPASAPPQAPCSRVEIEPKPNGTFTAKCSYLPPQNKRGMPPTPATPQETRTFATFDALVAGLRDLFGLTAPDGSAAPSGPSPTPDAGSPSPAGGNGSSDDEDY